MGSVVLTVVSAILIGAILYPVTRNARTIVKHTKAPSGTIDVIIIVTDVKCIHMIPGALRVVSNF